MDYRGIYTTKGSSKRKLVRKLITKEVGWLKEVFGKRRLKLCAHKTSNDLAWHGQPCQANSKLKYYNIVKLW